MSLQSSEQTSRFCQMMGGMYCKLTGSRQPCSACVCVWSWLQWIGKLGLYTLLHSWGCSSILMMNRDESPNSQMWWVSCTRSLNSHTHNKPCCHTDALQSLQSPEWVLLKGMYTHTHNRVQQGGSLARSISLCHHLKKPQWVSPIHQPPTPN